MFISTVAKDIGDAVRSNADAFRVALADSFEAAIVGEGREVRFFRKLLEDLRSALSSMKILGLNLGCRLVETHQKPIVRVTSPRAFRCELADLLVVVKYVLGDGAIERKSLLYQVKLCTSGTLRCQIDPNQLELLSDWPSFEFGRSAQGGPSSYNLSPKTLELGSFMLMQRTPARGGFIPCRTHFCNLRAYGISPYAREVQRNGPTTVDISTFPYAGNSADIFFSHLAFEIGEHHDLNSEVAELVGALYRHLGMDPDPPGEFEGYTRAVSDEEMGFAILEITINSTGDERENALKGSVWKPPGKKELHTSSYSQPIQQKMHYQSGTKLN
jgi:hypothetical protein